ncbi:MAG: DUF1302 family protein [Thermodesulfobacteriota bacterium]
MNISDMISGRMLLICGLLFIIPLTVQADTAAETANPPPTAAALTSEIQSVLSGFEETGDTPVYQAASGAEPSERAWDLSGEITLAAVCNISHEAPDAGQTDYRGLSRLRPELVLNLDVDLSDEWRCRAGGRGFRDFAYAIQGRDEFPHQVLDEYESEVELTEAYIEGPILPALDLKAGRQIVVWGNTENFRVTDMLNPIDNRDPAMVDIEDLRLPVGMAKLSYYPGDYALSVMAIPEIRFDKQPVLGNDFYPFDRTLPPEDEPDSGFENTEVALSLKGIFRGWDLSLYGAYLFNDESHFETTGSRDMVVGQAPLPDGGLAPIIVQVPVFQRRHARLAMTGCSLNVARGSWLYKTEIAYTDGLQFNTTPDEKSRIRGLAGIEYSGLTNTLIVIELVQTHLFDYEKPMGESPDDTEENRFETAFRVSRDLFHDRLELMLLIMATGGRAQDGAFERLTAEYEITDDLAFTAGCIFYHDGDSVMYGNIHDNNRVYMNLKYNF